jgi:D-arabinose 1-dehydrogenase-like Zn-dependent alcohol dehydrogenase
LPATAYTTIIVTSPNTDPVDACATREAGALLAERVPMSEVNTALDRLWRNDVRYRFVLSRD